jgi:ubiquinone/menaquinone biosynthesis C-methylase UbiE
MDDNIVKDFWESQAETFKDDVKAVNFDPLEEELELFFLDQLVQDGESVCDLGCGNGRTLFDLALRKPKSDFHGVDFAENMIKIASDTKNSLGVENITFYHLSAGSDDLENTLMHKYDKIISKRLLINLNKNDKLTAVQNIYKMLKDDGNYIMVECFMEPLERINRIREKLGLSKIKTKFFNEYLSEEFIIEICNMFVLEREIDFESLYYFISRVFNASLSQGEPDYHAPINRLSLELTKMGVNPIRGLSPEKIIIFNKKR